MSNTLVIAGQTYTNVAGIKAVDSSDATQTYVQPSGSKPISISSNGTVSEDVAAYASAQINVAVPNSYSAGDEGKVVSSGELVTQGSATYSSNGTYDTTLVSNVEVDVSGGLSNIVLVGTKVFTNLAEYTNTTTGETLDTEINIKNTDYAWGYVVVTCDTAITTSNEWGMTIAFWGRYTSNNNVYHCGSAMQKGASTFSRTAMVSGTAGTGSYGVTLLNNTSTIQLSRKCHSTGCPKVRAGNYTVKVYAIITN